MIPKIKIYPRQRIDKKGRFPFILSYVYKNQRNYITLGFSVATDKYNFEKQCLKKGCEDDTIFKLNFYEQKAKGLINEISFSDRDFTFLNFRSKFMNEKISDSFTDFVRDKLKNHSDNWQPLTLKSYNSHFNKLCDFQKNINFNELNKTLIEKYRNYLIKLGNNENSVNKGLSVLRTFVKWGTPDFITSNPFNDIKIKKINGNREFLTIDELKILENLYNTRRLRSELQNTLKVFVFCCYTGLRYSDVKQLKYANINQKEHFIKFTQQKTKEVNIVYLSKKAIDLIAPGPGSKIKDLNVLKVYSNQTLNYNLKEICNDIKLHKNITCHSARHTFATISLNDCNIDIMKVSSALGHKSIATTRIYTHLIEKTKLKAFEAWDLL